MTIKFKIVIIHLYNSAINESTNNYEQKNYSLRKNRILKGSPEINLRITANMAQVEFLKNSFTLPIHSLHDFCRI